MTHITIGDDTFQLRVEGDATRPALLLLNALGTDLSLWDGQMAALLPHFRVIRYNTRGHGDRAIGTKPVSIAAFGREVLALLDALDIETAHVIGLSMGGAVAQWLLANAPGRIERAVLANTAAKFGVPDGWNQRIGLIASKGMDSIAAATMSLWFSDAFRQAAPETVAKIHGMLRDMDPESYGASCAALRDLDLREAIRGIDRAVLVVTGRDDDMISNRDTETLLTAMTGARHVELDARHLSNIEAEAAFNEAVVAFLTAKIPVRKAPSPTQAPRKTRKIATRSSAARSPLKIPAAKTATAKRIVAKTAKPVDKKGAASKVPNVKKSTEAKATKTGTKTKTKSKAETKPSSRRVQAVAAAEARRPAAGKTAPAASRKSAAKRVAAKPVAAKPVAPKTTAKTKPSAQPKTKPAKSSSSTNTAAKIATKPAARGTVKKDAGKTVASKATSAREAAVTKPKAKKTPSKAAGKTSRAVATKQPASRGTKARGPAPGRRT